MKKTIAIAVSLLLLFTVAVVWGAGTLPPEIQSRAVRKALELPAAPSREDIENSRSQLIDLLKTNPKDIDAHMGMVHLRIIEHTLAPQAGTKGLEEALKHVNTALQLKPNREDAYRKKSLILLFLGRQEEGLGLLESALKKWPASPDLHEAYAAGLIYQGKIPEAERFCMLENSPVKNKEDLLLRLGEVWLQSGYGEQALECFERALNLKETPQAWAALGRCYKVKKEYRDAIEFFQKALAIDPQYAIIYNDLAYCYFQAGQLRDAVKAMELYTRSYPKDLIALGNLAGLYESAGEKIKARLTWTKVKANTRDPQQAALASQRLEKLKERQ